MDTEDYKNLATLLTVALVTGCAKLLAISRGLDDRRDAYSIFEELVKDASALTESGRVLTSKELERAMVISWEIREALDRTPLNTLRGVR